MSDRPTSELSRLDHRAPLPQASVNRVGPGWSNPGGPVDRTDARTYGPLSVLAPGELPPAPEPPPKPKPPVLTETERREQLVRAIASRDEAKAVMDAAVERHERALADEARCRDALASFAALPTEIDRHRELALRTGTDASLPATLRTKLQERGAAEFDLAAAERAVQIFRGEREAATRAHGGASWRLTAAIQEVTNIERDRLRPEMEALERKVEAYWQVIRRADGAGPWPAVVAGLMADPMGGPLAVEISDAPEPEPPAAPLVTPPPPAVVRIMRPAGDPRPVEVITEAELAARERAARMAASPMSAAMREAEAIAQARRGPR